MVCVVSIVKWVMRMEKFKYYKQLVGAIILAGIMVIVALRIGDIANAIDAVLSAFVPLILGACMAFVLDILVVRYERWLWPKTKFGWRYKIRRPLSIILSFVTISLIVYFIARMAVPQLIHSMSIIVSAAPQLYADFQVWIQHITEAIPFASNQTIMDTLNGESFVKYTREWGTKGGSYIVDTMGSVLSWTLNIGLGLIFAVYMLLDKERLILQGKRMLKAYASDVWMERTTYVGNVAVKTFSNFFVGQFIDALILGVMVGVTLWLFNIEYATTIACVIGLTGLIPLLGIYIGGVMGAVMLLTVNPMDALLYVVILEVLHQIESNVIYPKVVGNSIGLPGLWVFTAVIIGASLMGVTGMLVGVPLVATCYKLLMADVEARLASNEGL